MTCARSCGRSFLTKPMAASCAVSSLSSMLALVSSSSDSAIGRFERLKNVSSCLHAVLEDRERVAFEIGDEAAVAVGDGDVQRDEIDAAAERRLLSRAP